MSDLKLFVDLVSQPCRAVALLLEVNNIPYEQVYLSLLKGDHLKNAELKAANPNCKLPTLKDGSFSLYESGAILAYICSSQQVPDHWYPKDIKKRALVDQYLLWHPNLRSGFFYHRYVAKKPATDAKVIETKETLIKGLDTLNEHILRENKFIIGDEMSIADLQALSEITQFWMVRKDAYKGYPNVERWVADCTKALQPHLDKVYCDVYRSRDEGIFGEDPDPLKPQK